VNKQDKAVLDLVNDALAKAGLPLMQRHKFYPMQQQFQIDFGPTVLYIQPHLRRLSLFVRDKEHGKQGWGHSEEIGEYHGRGWKERLAQAVVAAVHEEMRV
jgi:hypothetical protein